MNVTFTVQNTNTDNNFLFTWEDNAIVISTAETIKLSNQ